MGDAAARHTYWIIRAMGSWNELDIQCRMEKTGARLAVFESRREADCVTKYLLDEYEDVTPQQYAIGIKVDESYHGVYKWNRVDVTSADQDAATLTFTNWAPTAPTGMSCVTMSAGLTDPQNGRWTDVDCSISALLYGVCEYIPTTS